MKVLYVSSEVLPFSKTGGLGDVAGTLPKYLLAEECDVVVVTPLYRENGVTITKPSLELTIDGVSAVVRKTFMDNVPVYLIDNPQYYRRDSLYGYSDDPERFSFFCKAVLELAKIFQPEIIHCNDWQSALVPVYLTYRYENKIKTIFTIHNLHYQGNFDKKIIPEIGLPWDVYTMDKMEFYGKVSFIKGGIVYSDIVTTVSETYAKEIQTPEFGCGLDGLLRYVSNKIVGILNGVDYTVWNPETDTHIYVNYNKNTLSRKTENKKMLQMELGLPIEDKPLFGMISRLSDQKGWDILISILEDIARDSQLIILGRGDEYYHNILGELKSKLKNVSVNLKFDEFLAHKIYAGCDFFLMPSKYEPCGLGQMISFKYGTIPVVRHTGGLVDTVVDIQNEGTGIIFEHYDPKDFLDAIGRAIHLYRDKRYMKKIRRRCMDLDFSWNTSAKKYIELYKKIL